LISFVIIGKNEAHNISRCLQSVINTIGLNGLTNAEIIYVDSASTDNSIEIASSFSNVNIFKITGKCNAAIARKIGVIEAIGDHIFFVDADREILPNFLANVLDKQKNLKYDIVTGIVMNVCHDYLGNIIKKEPSINLSSEIYYPVPGGSFLVRKKLFESAGFMDTKYVVFQDYDYGFKLAKRGIFTLIKNITIANHYTVDYKNLQRTWKSLLAGRELFRGVLYRDHFFNYRVYPVIFRNDSTAILLFILIILSLVIHLYQIMIIYLVVLFIRMLLQKGQSVKDKIARFPALILRDCGTILSFFFFYPSKGKISYVRVRNT